MAADWVEGCDLSADIPFSFLWSWSAPKISSMELPKQKRGVLLLFPSGENTTPPRKKESCAECERLESAYQAIINEINAAVRGPFASVGEKLTRLFQMQDERDRILAQFYSHKRELHPRKTG